MPTYIPTENDLLLARIQAGRIEEARIFLNQGKYDTLDMGMHLFFMQMDEVSKCFFMENLGKSLQETSVIALDLGSIGIDVVSAIALATNLPASLKRLDLEYNGMGTAIDDAAAVALAEALPAGLQSLSLGWNQMSAAGVVEVVKALPAGLQSLHLGGNAIGAAAVEVVKALRVGLQSLDLRFNAIGAAAVEVVKALPAGLQSLHLGGNAIGAAAVEVVKALRVGLQSLDLRFNAIGAAAVEVVKALPAGLQSLDLRFNEIGAAAVEVVKALPAGLQSLDLRFNEIGAAAVEVVKVLPEDLQSLDLGSNFIDNQSELTLVDALQKSGSTCSVRVFGNLMSDSMTARMRAVAFENALEKHRRALLEGAGLAQMLTQLNKTLDAAHQKFLPNEVVFRIGESKYLNNGLLYLRGFMEESKKIERETAAAAAAAARRASLRSATRIKLT